MKNDNLKNEKQCAIHDISNSKFNVKIIEFNLEKGIVNIKRAMLDTGKIYYFKHKWHNSDEDWINNIFSSRHGVTSMIDKFGKLN